MTTRRRKQTADWWVKTVRDLALVLTGIGLTIYEAFRAGPERPSLYVVYAGMMGLGPILRFAESKGKERSS